MPHGDASPARSRATSPQASSRARPAGARTAPSPPSPTASAPLVGNKDVWGHLPDELRQEMDNVAREEGAPSRKTS